MWLGPKASPSEKEKAWRIVKSIRFPPQRRGTMSGDFYVLKYASHYPPGAVVKFPGTNDASGPRDEPLGACVECAGEDLNLHGVLTPQGPQPCASTNSATSARRAV